MVDVFREVRRVLSDDGTLWLNLGDSYNSNTQNNHGKGGMMKHAHLAPKDGWAGHRPMIPGLKTKDLIGIPWRVAFALQADGWYLRSDIIWHKPNPMPESVRDRPTKAHEYLFLLSESRSGISTTRTRCGSQHASVIATLGREESGHASSERNLRTAAKV
jgi:DNA modification methylase